jgi:hypothetical protein
MMKKYLLLSALAGTVFFSCNTEDDSIRDMEAPVISVAEGRPEIRPRQGEIRGRTSDHMDVRFSVTDPSGIKEVKIDIHAVFDGHSHGRIGQQFERLNIIETIPVNGATFYNHDGHDYYWEGPNSMLEGELLAGPYDVIFSASDIHGNATSVADGTSYFTTMYIERPYAPNMQITNLEGDELEGQSGEALNVQGRIFRDNHALSSDITFLWVRLAEEDDHDDEGDHGEDVYERMWGTSVHRTHSNQQAYSGPALPSGADINLGQILAGDNAIVLPAGEEHYELIIWTEDANGNVTRRKFDVHAN